MHCTVYTWYDTCTHALTRSHTPRPAPFPVRPARVRSAAGGRQRRESGGSSAAAPRPAPPEPRDGTPMGRRGEDPAAAGGLSARALPAAAALPVQKGGGLGSAAPQSTRRDADGAAAGGALGKGLHQNRSFLRAVWILKLLHHPHEKGLNEEFVKTASSSKLGKSESNV